MWILLLSLASAAEPWGDGFGDRAPVSFGAELAWNSAWGPSDLQQLGLALTAPLHTSRARSWTVGVGLRGGLSHLSIPDEDRSTTQPRSLRGELQFSFFGPRRESLHGIGVLGGAPPGESLLYWDDDTDRAAHFALYYDGYVASRWVDVSMRTELGIAAGDLIVHAKGELAVIAKPLEVLALHAGVSGGLVPIVWANVGVRVRPVEALEVGLSAAIPITSLYGIDVRDTFAPLHPSLEVRAHLP